jgi:uncharacterized Zn-binding protein involved in type VI secretion
MPFPAARVGVDAAIAPTCPITGPGAPTVLVNGVMASCVGDAVAGAAPAPNVYAGTITGGSARVVFAGRPAAYIGSTTNGTMTVPAPPGPPVVTPGTPGAIVAGVSGPSTVILA